MGLGDDLIATSIARKAFTKTGKLVMIGDGITLEKSPVFENNPILSPVISPTAVWARVGLMCRPYIDYTKTDSQHQAYNYSFRVEPGEIHLLPEELDFSQRDFILIEPNVKGSYGGNKDWGFDKWQRLVDELPECNFVQCGHGRILRGVEVVPVRSFRHACGLLSHARLFVGTDGGLHHAAAAVGTGAVVVWGGLAPPAVLGYEGHINLCHAKEWCGSTKKCGHCSAALAKVSVDEVRAAILGHH